jgi:hypothetical protein
LISEENINMQTKIESETALATLFSSNSFKNWDFDCYEDRRSAISTTAHTLLDHGADCNIKDYRHYGPLRAYLGTTKDLCLSLVERMINQTVMLDEVYRSILSYFLNDYISEAILNHKWLLQHLPRFCLTQMEIQLYPEYAVIYIRHTETDSCQYSTHCGLRVPNSQVFDATCMLLLETSMINSYILPNVRYTISRSTPAPQFIKQVKKKIDRFSETQYLPSSLVKLCILGIRQHMTSKRDEDFNCLHLPNKLRSLVTFEYLVQEWKDIVSAQ